MSSLNEILDSFENEIKELKAENIALENRLEYEKNKYTQGYKAKIESLKFKMKKFFWLELEQLEELTEFIKDEHLKERILKRCLRIRTQILEFLEDELK